MEGISIIENASLAGLPIPKVIKNALEIISKKKKIKMNNPELVVTIITTVLTIVSALLGFLATKNEKAIKEFCIIAENNYTDKCKKKKYVISSVNKYLNDNNLTFDSKLIEEIIETLISVTKKINLNYIKKLYRCLIFNIYMI